MRDSIDPEMLLVLLFGWSAAVTNGIVRDNLIPFVDIGHVLVSAGNLSLSIASVISGLALGVVLFNRDTKLASVDGFIEMWIGYVTIALVISPPFLPFFRETLFATAWGFIAFSIQTAGFFIISYKN